MISYDNDNDNQPIQITDFVYPKDEKNVVNDEKINQLLNFIAYYVLTDSNPKLCLIALCYSAGYDVGTLYNTRNNISAIAKANGIGHSTLVKKIMQIESHIGLKKWK